MNPSTYGLSSTAGFYGQLVPYMPAQLRRLGRPGSRLVRLQRQPDVRPQQRDPVHGLAHQGDGHARAEVRHQRRRGSTRSRTSRTTKRARWSVASWGQPGATGSTFGNLLTATADLVPPGDGPPERPLPAVELRGLRRRTAGRSSATSRSRPASRFSYMPNNTEINGLAAHLRPRAVRPEQGRLPRRAATSRRTASSTRRTGDVPDRLIDNRGLFWMPRVNFAWDVTRQRRPGHPRRRRRLLQPAAGQRRVRRDCASRRNAYSSHYPPWDGFSFDQLPGVDPFTILGRPGPDHAQRGRQVTTRASRARASPSPSGSSTTTSSRWATSAPSAGTC